ncbi:hypothetical protein EPN96_09415 [bacterium]|nr:MAG: hypothetical protein EPN96_09415 [bacterium]
MANISNVSLAVVTGTGGASRQVTVSYTIYFTSCEVTAKSAFVEKVILRASDVPEGGADSDLATLKNACVRADTASVSRTVTVSVSRSTLDEDKDILVLPFVRANADEIYAHVSLTPFVTRGATGNSNTVTGQFGLLGRD